MEFNVNWTKDDNDTLRTLIKERKSFDDIRISFTLEKIEIKKYQIHLRH